MIALGAIMMAVGVGYGNRMLVGFGAALTAPSFLYLAGTSRFAGWALAPLVLNLVAAVVVEKRRVLAAVLLFPGLALIVFVVVLVSYRFP